MCVLCPWVRCYSLCTLFEEWAPQLVTHVHPHYYHLKSLFGSKSCKKHGDISFPAFAGISALMESKFQHSLEAFSQDSHTFSGFSGFFLQFNVHSCQTLCWLLHNFESKVSNIGKLVVALMSQLQFSTCNERKNCLRKYRFLLVMFSSECFIGDGSQWNIFISQWNIFVRHHPKKLYTFWLLGHQNVVLYCS